MNNTSSDREDFSRRKFLTGVTRGLLASAVVATNAGAVMPSPAQDTVPVDDEQLKRNLKLSQKNQFALEMDHFSECVQANKTPYTPGEEGLQDHHLMEAIYESAKTGKPVRLMAAAPSELDRFRGSPPQS
jgi:predicted dehydrogenase